MVQHSLLHGCVLCGLPGSTSVKEQFIAGEGHSILPQNSLIIDADLDTKRSPRFGISEVCVATASGLLEVDGSSFNEIDVYSESS